MRSYLLCVYISLFHYCDYEMLVPTTNLFLCLLQYYTPATTYVPFLVSLCYTATSTPQNLYTYCIILIVLSTMHLLQMVTEIHSGNILCISFKVSDHCTICKKHNTNHDMVLLLNNLDCFQKNNANFISSADVTHDSRAQS